MKTLESGDVMTMETTRRDPGEVLHNIMTGCPDIWRLLSPNEQADWVETAHEFLEEFAASDYGRRYLREIVT